MNPRRPPASRQRGVAALVVVLVLFLVVSLVAAYTSRNLIFEQRTATNQYRATQAQEAAEAGIEWALTMLNRGLIDASCEADASGADSFRQRYLAIDPEKGMIEPATVSGEYPHPTCVLDRSSAGGGAGGGTADEWKCDCPSNATTSIPSVSGSGPHPAFRVGFTPSATQPGVVQIHAIGCTAASEGCLAFSPTMASGAISQALAPGNEGAAAVSAWAGLTAHLPAVERVAGTQEVLAVMPRDTVTARQAIVKIGGGELRVHRQGSSPGVPVRAGGAVSGVLPYGPPGTPNLRELLVLESDTGLDFDESAPVSARDRMFASLFNMLPQTFADQPGIVRLDCAATCTASTLVEQVRRHPGLPLWVEGDLTIDQPVDVGSSDWPALIVVDGNLRFTSSSAQVYGLMYGRAENWTLGTLVRVRGALVAENGLSISINGGDVFYDEAVLRRLNTLTGSFVRIPGGWKDFP